MKYNDIKDLPFDDERTEALNTCTKVFQEGEVVIGELIEMNPFTSDHFTGESIQYVMKTDEGRISFFLGQATDKMIADKVKVGQVLYIKFNGKLELSNGREFNSFQITDVTKLWQEKIRQENLNSQHSSSPKEITNHA